MKHIRLLVCGSAGDGKSTLIDYLISASAGSEQTGEFADHDARARFGSSRSPRTLSAGGAAPQVPFDTHDPGCRSFESGARQFTVYETSEIAAFASKMATTVGGCDAALIVIDASMQRLVSTRHHVLVAHVMGVKNVIVVVNKMDLASHAEDVFSHIQQELIAYAKQLGLEDFAVIPVVACDGGNVVQRSDRTGWYGGPPLIELLAGVKQTEDKNHHPLRVSVRSINGTGADNRYGFTGMVLAGELAPGTPVVALPAGQSSLIEEVENVAGSQEGATTGALVTARLKAGIALAPGDILAATDNRPQITDQFAAEIIWLSDKPLLEGRQYQFRIAQQSSIGTVTALRHKTDVHSLEHLAADQLATNDVGRCHIALSKALVYEPFDTNRHLGSVVVVDPTTGDLSGVGAIQHGLRRAENVHWQAVDVNKASRSKAMRQKPCCLWLTGLSGSGKSTIANAAESMLHQLGQFTYLLDGDNVRHGLNRDLGFTEADRVENIRRVAEVAKLMVDAGLVVLVSFISPYRAERGAARALFDEGEFYEIFVDTPLEVCERRDVKGLYQKARSGQIPNFTGITAPYERPAFPDITLDGANDDIKALARSVVDVLLD